MAREQSVLGFVELQEVVELHFLDDCDLTIFVYAAVGDDTGVFPDIFDGDFQAVYVFDGFAPSEPDPGEWGIFNGINSSLAACDVEDGYPVVFGCEYDAKTQFGFGFADPALAWNELRQGGSPGWDYYYLHAHDNRFPEPISGCWPFTVVGFWAVAHAHGSLMLVDDRDISGL